MAAITICSDFGALRLLCPWDSPGKNTGVGSHFLLQGIFVTQGLNVSRVSCTPVNYLPLSHQGSPTTISVPFSSVTQSRPTLCDPMDCSTQGFPVHHQLLELAQTQGHQVGDTIQSSHPLSSPFPPASVFLSIRVFSNKLGFCIRWPKYWNFSFRISASNEHPGLISFRMEWLDLLAVQGTLKRLLQNLSSKTSILQCSAFFMVQLSHPYMTTGKTIALTRWTFVSKVVSAF